jgi:hypothetical protein
VGGVSERPARERQEQSLRVPVSQRWKAPWFAGCRQPSRADGETRVLAGPARLYGARPVQPVAPATTGVLWKNEEGNVVRVRQAHALAAVTLNRRRHERGHVLRSVQRPVHVIRLGSLMSDSPEAAQAEVGQEAQQLRYRGRATPRKWEQPAPGSESLDALRGSPRVTASLLRSRSREGRA